MSDIKRKADPVDGLTAGQGYHWYHTWVDFPILMRGAQPSDNMFGHLGDSSNNQHGIKCIISLRNKMEEYDYAHRHGMRALYIGAHDHAAPRPPKVQRGDFRQFELIMVFLDFVSRPENQPAFVHCRLGQGRTGTFCACYRMAYQGWSADAAIADGNASSHRVLNTPVQQDFIRAFEPEAKKIWNATQGSKRFPCSRFGNVGYGNDKHSWYYWHYC